MSDSDGYPQRDDRHHCQSRSRSPVSPACARETPEEREERQLAEAAVPVGPPAVQPQAAPGDPRQPAPDPVLARGGAPAARAVAPTAPPPGGAPDAQGAAAAAPARHATAPGTPPARATGPVRTPGASLGTATAAAESKEGAKYRAHTRPRHTHTSPPKPYPPKAAFPQGRPRPVRPPTPKRTPPGIRLPQLRQRVVGKGGTGTGTQGEERTAAAGGWQAEEEGMHQGRRRRGQQRKGTNTGEGPGRTRRQERVGARAGRHCQRQRGAAGARDRHGHWQRKEGHTARKGARAGTRRKRQQGRAKVACLPGRGGGAPRHGRGGQCLAAPGPAYRPRSPTLPPEEPATAAAAGPTQTEAHVTASPEGDGPTPGRNARREPRTPDGGGGGGLTDGPGRPPWYAQAPQL